jgi:hypothetical protein
VQGFFEMAVLPTPLGDDDRTAGYWWELSMRQVEVSRTLVFDDPRRARGFFEALVSDNIGIGRPAEVRAVFGINRRGRTTAMPFGTRVFQPGTEVKISVPTGRLRTWLKELNRCSVYRVAWSSLLLRRQPGAQRRGVRATKAGGLAKAHLP